MYIETNAVFVVPFADSEPDDTKGPIVIDVDDMGLCNDSDSRPSSVEPSAKSIRTGKQYKCPHCSYSADKKVSTLKPAAYTLTFLSN